MENIFVPSKGRANTSSLIKLAQEQNIRLTVVVEPQEADSYLSSFPEMNYILLPLKQQGITYVRNYIKEFTERNSIGYYWQLDDDISNLYTREGTKLTRTGFDCLISAGNTFIKNKISLGALEYRQFAWSASKDLTLNSFCDTCVFVDNRLTNGMRYRPYLEGKEDRDFAMQIIKSGGKTARITTLAFSSPPNGSNVGGLKEIFYDQGKELQCVDRMIEIWGDRICNRITKENGRVDVKINWNEINSRQSSLF